MKPESDWKAKEGMRIGSPEANWRAIIRTHLAMKPVLILQHLSGDGPAYLASWLRAGGIAFDLRNTEAGQSFPDRIEGYSALAILGGEMSANDALPSLRQAEALFLQAVRHGVPTLGHCLGGQLMARALGAQVLDSPAPEVGWQSLEPRDGAAARAWFGDAPSHTVFHWHYEAFSLPAGAEWLATSAACPHQAFSVGPHLAMQFHVELDADKLQRWSSEFGPFYDTARRNHPQTVHSGEQMRLQAKAALPAQQRLADRLYGRWIALARSLEA
jgi:GMP synthase-like glutamine amidotransferase